MEGKKLKLGQRLLMIVISTLVFLALIEAVVRLAGVNTDLARNKNFEIGIPVWLLSDPNWVINEASRLKAPRGVKAVDVAWLANFEEARYIQYKAKPSLDLKAVNSFNDIEVRKNATFRITTNKDGFRTHPFVPKKDGVLRIVSLGDSSTFGWGVDNEYTYQSLLERKLALSRGGAVEVFNLGIPGHTTRHGLGILHHYAWDLKPDVLLVSFGGNDARFMLQTIDQVLAADDTLLGGVRWTLFKLKTFKLLRRLVLSASDPFKAPAKSPEKKPTLVPAVSIEGYKANLKAMIAEAHRRGVAVVLIGVCSTDTYLGAMAEVAQSENVPFVDAKKLFQDSIAALKEGRLYKEEVDFYRNIYGDEAMAGSSWMYVTTDGCHPNRAGTNLIADALAPAVEKALATRPAVAK
jgi:lysophospholipase L1-like esterase